MLFKRSTWRSASENAEHVIKSLWLSPLRKANASSSATDAFLSRYRKPMKISALDVESSRTIKLNNDGYIYSLNSFDRIRTQVGYCFIPQNDRIYIQSLDNSHQQRGGERCSTQLSSTSGTLSKTEVWVILACRTTTIFSLVLLSKSLVRHEWKSHIASTTSLSLVFKSTGQTQESNQLDTTKTAVGTLQGLDITLW